MPSWHHQALLAFSSVLLALMSYWHLAGTHVLLACSLMPYWHVAGTHVLLACDLMPYWHVAGFRCNVFLLDVSLAAKLYTDTEQCGVLFLFFLNVFVVAYGVIASLSGQLTFCLGSHFSGQSRLVCCDRFLKNAYRVMANLSGQLTFCLGYWFFLQSRFLCCAWWIVSWTSCI